MKKIHKHKPRIGKFLRYILVGGALVITFSIFQQRLNAPSLSPTPSALPVIPSNLTEDERFILSPPSADASKSAKEKHAQTVAKLAKEGNSLDIKDCKPNPLVLQVKQGSQIDIVNKDSIEHKIIVDTEHFYNLPANSKKTITVQFKYGTGDYGYVCEGTGLVGFMHITP